MNIKINGDLFQWEKNRIISVDFNRDKQNLYAQIFNCKTDVCELIPILDNSILIPDKLLEQPYPITVIICTEDQVISRKEFRVLKRPKPSGYNMNQFNFIKIDNLIGGDI